METVQQSTETSLPSRDPTNFAEEEITEFKRLFDMFDPGGSGLLHVSDVKTVMRSVGHNHMTCENHVINMISANNLDQSLTDPSYVDFKTFLLLMSISSDLKHSNNTTSISNLNCTNSNGSFSSDYRPSLSTDTEMRQAFQTFDRDGDGLIDKNELRLTMKELLGEKLSKSDVKAMIKAADKNGDGKIDYQASLELKFTSAYNRNCFFKYPLERILFTSLF